MIRKGLQIINIIALLISGLAFSWMYTEHTDIAPKQNEQLYNKKIQEINKFTNIDDLKKSYIEQVNSSKNDKRIHNYNAEKYVNALLTVIVLLGLNFVFLIILNEQLKKETSQELRK
ncbi:MAG: hypothetical protein OEY78_07270 [Gammaproteobacteria bacterium]|nr:hypothetical protein [Gammaproteobacteria bacterium]